MNAFSTMLFLGLPHGMEWIMIAVIGLLLFGKKLPGIARSLGQSVVEFKKGIKGVKDEIEDAATRPVEDKSERRTIDVAASSQASASNSERAHAE